MKKYLLPAAFLAAAVSFHAPPAYSCIDDPRATILLTLRSERADEFMEQGNMCAERMEYEKAVEAYDKVIREYPRYGAAHFNKGLALSALGRLEQAIEAYDSAIALDRDNAARYYNNKGNALGRLGRAEDALDAFNRAIEIDSTYASAYYNKSIALDSLGLKKEANEAMRKAISLDPELERMAR